MARRSWEGMTNIRAVKPTGDHQNVAGTPGRAGGMLVCADDDVDGSVEKPPPFFQSWTQEQRAPFGPPYFVESLHALAPFPI